MTMIDPAERPASEIPGYDQLSLTQIFIATFRYGNWTGGGYSAGVFSPPFVALTEDQLAVEPIDAFDAVSKDHDIKYNDAQQFLLREIAAGVSEYEAYAHYHNAIAAADRAFVEAASNVTASTEWGETVRHIGIAVLSANGAYHAAMATYDESLGAVSSGFGGLLNIVQSAISEVINVIGSAFGSETSPQITSLDDGSQSFQFTGDPGSDLARSVTVKPDGTTEVRLWNDNGAQYNSNGRQTDTILYAPDRTTYTKLDAQGQPTGEVTNLWQGGLITGTGSTSDGGYEFTRVNGGELRSYADGRMVFVAPQGQQTEIPDSDPDFSWDNVPGYSQSFGEGPKSVDTGSGTSGDGSGTVNPPIDLGGGSTGGDFLGYGGDHGSDISVPSDVAGGDITSPSVPTWTTTTDTVSVSVVDGGQVIFTPVDTGKLSNSFAAQTYVAPATAPRCFVGETPVLMADGSEKPIAAIVVGDSVMAFDGNGDLEPRPVTRTFVHDDVETEPFIIGDGRTFAASSGHRVLSAGGGFKSLSQLDPGESVLAADGRPVRLARAAGGSSRARVYNLTVDTHHTYVAAGIRVHNTKPIVIDLSGDNKVELIGLDESGVLFDMDGDGFKENTAWVGPNDGLLAYDKGGDGKIAQADEIVFARYAAHPGASDLEGLRAGFDSNHDGALDARDTGFGLFGVWRDANQNGRTDAGEFRTLADLGILSISLTGSGGGGTDGSGNTILATTHLTKADGSTMLVADVDLAVAEPGYAEIQRRPSVSILRGEQGQTAAALVEGTALRQLNVGALGVAAGFGTSKDDILLTTGSGAVTLEGGAGKDMLVGGGGNDVLKGGQGSDRISGGAGDDLIYADAADTSIDGGAGRDTMVVASGDGLSLDLGAAHIEIAHGNDGADHLFTTGTGGVTVTGGAGNDIIEGGGGNDDLSGGTGSDTLKGGAGSDVLRIDSADTLIDGGDGNDLIIVEGTGGVRLDLGASHIEMAMGGGGDDAFSTSGSGAVTINAGLGNDTLTGGTGADTLLGGDGNDIADGGAGTDHLDGGAGTDWLKGGAGNDLLIGGAGRDTLVGGSGDDVLVVDADDALAALDGGDGADTLRVVDIRGVSIDIGLANIEFAIGGSGADQIITSGIGAVAIDGGAGNDLLSGGIGKDTLTGGDGDDRLLGGADNDTLVGGAGSDGFQAGSGDDLLVIDGFDAQANIDGGDGTDTVLIEDTFGVSLDAGAAHVERVIGGDGADRLRNGGVMAVTFEGGAGNDTLSGGSGNDTLVGGAGSDVLKGGAGDDRLIIDAADLAINIDGGDGRDTLEVATGSAGVTIDAAVAHVELLLGGEGNDTFTNTGSSGVTLKGGAGRDVLKGGGGDDLIIADGDDQIMQGGSGRDTLEIEGTKGVALDLGQNGIEVAFGGSGDDHLWSALSSGINVDAGAGNDQLAGGSGADSLLGGAGNDLIDGGAGNDFLKAVTPCSAAAATIPWGSMPVTRYMAAPAMTQWWPKGRSG